MTDIHREPTITIDSLSERIDKEVAITTQEISILRDLIDGGTEEYDGLEALTRRMDSLEESVNLRTARIVALETNRDRTWEAINTIRGEYVGREDIRKWRDDLILRQQAEQAETAQKYRDIMSRLGRLSDLVPALDAAEQRITAIEDWQGDHAEWHERDMQQANQNTRKFTYGIGALAIAIAYCVGRSR